MTESTANTEQVAEPKSRQRIFRRGHSRVRRLRALRSLRPVPESVPDLQIVGPRSRFAARPHSPDRSGGPGPAAAGRFLREAYRSVPGLPRVRDGVSFRRAIRKTGRSGARADRAELPAAVFFAHRAGFCFPADCCRIRAASRRWRGFSTSTSDPACNRSRERPEFFACWGLPNVSAFCRRLTANSFSRIWAAHIPPSAQRRARVALFAGCIAQVSFSKLHEATIRVLTANGCEVVVPGGTNLLRRAGRACRSARRRAGRCAHQPRRFPER